MTARPVDWTPLPDHDPVAGDVAAVRTEATYYSDLAQEISGQVDRLKKIASQDDLLGKAADKLHDSAGDTADKLNQTHGRVAAVGSALTKWIPHFEQAQADTLTALHDAQNAQADQNANQPPPAGSPAPKTADEKQADSARANRLSSANSALEAASTRFDNAVDTKDSEAQKIASEIKDALHDGLKDGFWDHSSNWVSQHVDMIKMVVEVLTWVATAVAIACIFIPGLNILAIALTVAVLAGHSLLAATGNGSWVDVAIDAFALLTLGAGRLASSAAEEARALTLVRAGDLAAESKAAEVTLGRAALRAEYEAASNGLGKFTLLKGLRSFISLKSGFFDAATNWKAGWAAAGAKFDMITSELPDVDKLQSMKSLGKDLAQNMKQIKALRAGYGDDADFARLAAGWERYIRFGQGTVGAGQAVDLTNHVISTSVLPGVKTVLPGVPAWEHFKEHEVTGHSWAARE